MIVDVNTFKMVENYKIKVTYYMLNSKEIIKLQSSSYKIKHSTITNKGKRVGHFKICIFINNKD